MSPQLAKPSRPVQPTTSPFSRSPMLETISTSQPPPLLAVSVGWFDPVFLALLGFGYWRGMHNGASNENFHVVKWFFICLAAAGLSGPLGHFLAKWVGRSPYAGAVLGYAIGGGVTFIVFAALEGFNVNSILGPEFFGKGETHVGGGLGLMKALLILMVPLALLHGRHFGPNPTTLHGRMRAAVFDHSLSGAALMKTGGLLLIKPVGHTGGARKNAVTNRKNQEMNKASQTR